MNTIYSRCSRLFNFKLVRLLAVLSVNFVLVSVLTGATMFKYSVVITDDDIQTIVFTSEAEPAAILAQKEIPIGEDDEYVFSGFVEQKATIDINRAKAITVHADGRAKTANTLTETIGEALDEMNITILPDDLINVSLTEPMSDGAEITINRVVHQTVETVEELPYETISFPTSSMKAGKVKVLKPGVIGTKTTVRAQTLIDGDVVEDNFVSEDIVDPVTARVQTGDPNGPVSLLIPPDSLELDSKGNPVSYAAKYTGKATAYSALGARTSLKPGNVAMNLSKFPKGTKLYIKTPNGGYVYGYSSVKDTGVALNEGIILVDLFFNTYAESCAFGAKNIDVYVLN